jgi:membrane dipeptidase
MKGVLLLVALVVVLIGGRIVLGLLLKPAPPVLTPEEEALRTRALELHNDAIVVDGHNDLSTFILDFGFDLGMDGDEPHDRSPLIYAFGPLTWLPNPPYGDEVRTNTDLARAREGGLDVLFFSVWPECGYYESGGADTARRRALDKLEALQESVLRHPDQVEFAFSTADVARITTEGKLAPLMALEGGHVIEDLEQLHQFYDLGVRRLTLAQDCSHKWADSCRDDPVAHGLSEFGRKVVQEMSRLGMIVDISHASDKTFWDVIAVANAPVIASHSNARALANHLRNMDDDMLRALAETDGVVMVNFSSLYLDPRKTAEWKVFLGWHWFTHPRQPETPLSLLVDHIDHIVQVAGIDHVGLGSDFDGGVSFPLNLKDVSDYPNITMELIRRGYSDEDIRKILGGNILRVLADVEAIAAQPLWVGRVVSNWN